MRRLGLWRRISQPHLQPHSCGVIEIKGARSLDVAGRILTFHVVRSGTCTHVRFHPNALAFEELLIDI